MTKKICQAKRGRAITLVFMDELLMMSRKKLRTDVTALKAVEC